MALPLLLTFYWQTGASSSLAADWFNFKLKWRWVGMALRDRWEWYDQMSLVVVALLILGGLFHRKLTFSRNLAFSSLVLITVYAL